MTTALTPVQPSTLSKEECTELGTRIDAMIAAHKGNRQEINRLVFESVSAMTAGEDYERQLANKTGLRRFWGGITGSNKKLQDKINSSRSAAQYAAQLTLQRLAEQNMMTFDLLAAVNNKLNAFVYATDTEINQIYNNLLCFVKESRSNIVRLSNRVDRLERNVNLLNWQNSIEYQVFQGIEYSDLDPVEKLVCLARDFYDITQGNWTTSDLLLLKTAMDEIDISLKSTIGYYDCIQTIESRQDLAQYLLAGKQMTELPAPYLVPMLGMKKLELLDGDECGVVDTLIETLAENGVQMDREVVRHTLVKKYLRQQSQVNVDVQVNTYDLVLEMLFNLQMAESDHLLTLPTEVQENEKEARLSVEDLCAYGDLLTRGVGVEIGDMFGLNDESDEVLGDISVEHYRIAAAQGCARAQCLLGDCYYDGTGVEEDEEQAVEWYRRAAEQGDPWGQIRMGMCYALGVGGEADDEQRRAWFQKAAESGNSYAQLFVGMEMAVTAEDEEDEECAEERKEEGIKWMSEAAEQGDVLAQMLLCGYYGSNGNEEQAVVWLRKAAEQGYDRAQC